MPRLFLALWPDQPLRQDILRIAGPLLTHFRGRPVEPDRLHLTLAFLGEVPAEAVPTIEGVAMAAASRHGPLDLSLDRTGVFANAGVLWLGGAGDRPLLALHEDLAAALAEAGHPLERRPFRPHVTLSRRVPRDAELHARLRGEADPPVRWRAEELTLVSSHTEPEGAVYRVLRRWPLAGGMP